MANKDKKFDFGAMTSDKKEKETSSTEEKKETITKEHKEPSQRFNIRIPANLAARLDAASKKTGLSKSAIMIRGLYSELNEVERK